MAFIDDIQLKDTAIFPVVTFVLFKDTDNEATYRISIKPFTLEGEHYSPLLLSSPSIKESIDLESRKYKISNVSLKISNVEYNGLRFTDTQIPTNTEVSIHWVSPSCAVITDCYLAYKGFVRAIDHDEKTCNITLEDTSQSTLHKDVPVSVLGVGDEVPQKYKNKPIPMVYGVVDYSPCVIVKNIDDASISIKADNVTIEGFNESLFLPSSLVRSPLNFYSGSKIVNISHYTLGTVNSTHDSHYQFEISPDAVDNNYMTITPEYTEDASANPANNYADDLLECQIFRIPDTPTLIRHEDQPLNPYDYVIPEHPLRDATDGVLSTYLEWHATEVYSLGTDLGVWFSMSHNNFEPYGVEDSILYASTYYITKFDLVFINGFADGGLDYRLHMGDSVYHGFYEGYTIGFGDSVSFNNFDESQDSILLDSPSWDGAILSNNLRSFLYPTFSGGGEFNIKIYGVALWHILEYDFHDSSAGILDKTFYVNINGRVS